MFISLSSKCFTRRNRLAIALYFCGASFGGFVAPLFSTVTLVKYGYFGSILLMAGVYLHVVPCGLTLGHWNNLLKRWKSRSATMGETQSTKTNSCHCTTFISGNFRSLRIVYKNYFTTPHIFVPTFVCTLHILCQISHYIVLPSFGLEVGLTPLQAAWTAAIANLTEIPSRLLTGLLLDKGLISENILLLISGSIMTLGGVAVYNMTSLICLEYRFVVLCGYSFMFGIMGSIAAVVYLSCVRRINCKLMGRASALVPAMVGLGTLLGPLFLGEPFAIVKRKYI